MPVALVALTVLTATLAGVGAERRWGVRADRAAGAITRLLLYGLLPGVILVNVAALRVTAAVGAGIAFGYAGGALACLVAWLAGSRLLRLERPALGAAMVCSFAGNTGYLGLPICAALLGFGAIGDAAAYDALVSAPSVVLAGFSIGAAYGRHAERAGARARSFVTRNPPLLAGLVGLALPAGVVPGWLLDASRIALVAMTPLGFLVVGIVLAHERAIRLDRAAAMAMACKLTIPLGTMALLSALVLRVPDAYLLQAAMPCGVNAILIATAYRLDRGLVAATVAWSTAIVLLGALALGAAGV